MPMREKVGKSRNTVFFQIICGSKGSKSRLAKAAGAEPAGQMRDEKLHAVVARSTFPSQNVQSTPASDGPLLAVEMLKKCTPLWREAHFQVKTYKAPNVRATFGGSDVEKVHAVVARSTFRSQNVQSTRVSDHFWRFRCRFASLHYIALHYTPLHCTALHYTTLHNTTTTTTQLHSTTLHYTKSHYTTLHYTTLRSTTLHYITLHYATFHYTSLHYTTLHSTTTTTTQLHSTTIHSTTLSYTTLHDITLHCTTLPSTTLHYITLHYTPLHYNYNYECTTTLHYTPLH